MHQTAFPLYQIAPGARFYVDNPVFFAHNEKRTNEENETGSDRMKKRKLAKIVALSLAAVLLLAAGTGIFVFRGLIVTLLRVKPDAENGVYFIDYKEDYALDDLLDKGGVSTQEELAEYIIGVLLKGLPIPIDYDVPNLACSTFNADTPDGGFVFGRNLDNQTTDLAVVKTAPKNGYRSVSVVNLSFLGYNETHTPEKLFDRIVAMGAPYFPLDGINEKGLAVGVLQLQAPRTDQNTDKPDVDTTLAIRVLLDKAATVDEAIDLLKGFDMHASAGGCYHLQLADAAGNGAVVSYVNDELVVTPKEGNWLCATNFYLHEVPFNYEPQGVDRYDGMVETLTGKNGVLSLEEGMALLGKVALTGTAPDEQGRSYSTQWSSVYDLTNPSLTLCPDRNYEKVYTYAP